MHLEMISNTGNWALCAKVVVTRLSWCKTYSFLARSDRGPDACKTMKIRWSDICDHTTGTIEKNKTPRQKGARTLSRRWERESRSKRSKTIRDRREQRGRQDERPPRTATLNHLPKCMYVRRSSFSTFVVRVVVAIPFFVLCVRSDHTHTHTHT